MRELQLSCFDAGRDVFMASLLVDSVLYCLFLDFALDDIDCLCIPILAFVSVHVS